MLQNEVAVMITTCNRTFDGLKNEVIVKLNLLRKRMPKPRETIRMFAAPERRGARTCVPGSTESPGGHGAIEQPPTFAKYFTNLVPCIPKSLFSI